MIICSARPERLQAVTRNIEATIGVEYELIAVDNSVEGLSLIHI